MENAVRNEAVSPSRLLKIFEEAPSQHEICNGVKSESSEASKILLPGEVIEHLQENVTCVGTLSNFATGSMYVTSYRVIFRGSFCHNPNDGGSYSLDQDEIIKRGYRYQNKRYKLPKVNSGIKKIGQSVRRKGKSIKSAFKRQQVSNSESNVSHRVANDEVDLLRIRLGSHVTLEKVNLSDSDTGDDVIADCRKTVLISLPLISIHDVRKFPKQFLDREKVKMLRDGIEITCNDLTSVKFCIGSSDSGDIEGLLTLVDDRVTRQKSASAFAYVYAANLQIPDSCREMIQNRTSPNFYNFDDEVRRMKLNQHRHVETIEQNFCPRYPRHVIVPSSIQEREELRKLAEFHRNNCFPIVTWKSQSSGGFLLRSSIPQTPRGQPDQRCKVDEKLINGLGSLSPNRDAKVWIFTEKPKVSLPSSNSSQSGLKVSEGEAYYYPHCKFVNDDLPDPQSVQQNGLKLMNALSYKTDDSKYLSQIEDSGWLENIRRLLEISSSVAWEIENEKSTVLVAYDDGVDRTAQIVSLVQLLADPYYRTLNGFQVLIQKEWLSIRHPFFSRNLSRGINDDDLSPIFLQFLDCVWQLTRQFPLVFEFNEHFIETLVIHSYSGRFGTFLDFETNGIVGENPVSFWTWLNVVVMAKDDFSNSNYDQSENNGPIFPIVAAPWIRLWTWHYRYKTEDSLVLAQHIGCMQLEKLQREYRDQLEVYQSLLTQLSDIDAISAEAFHTRNSGSVLVRRTVSCATNYSYHLETNSEQKPRFPLLSIFAKKSKSFDSLLSITAKDQLGKSQFYAEVDSENNEKSKIGTFPRSEMIRNHGNLRTVLNKKGITFHGVVDVKVTENTCSGYLVKQGKVRKSWRRRWFVLDARKGCVAYFGDHLSDQPIRVFKCTFITDVYPHRNQDKHPNLFYINTVDRLFATEAPNVTTMKVWLGCFNAIIS